MYMRIKLAKRLVKWIAKPMDHSYEQHMNYESFGWPFSLYMSRKWAVVHKHACKLLPVAYFLHKDAALDQMACEGWWG